MQTKTNPKKRTAIDEAFDKVSKKLIAEAFEANPNRMINGVLTLDATWVPAVEARYMRYLFVLRSIDKIPKGELPYQLVPLDLGSAELLFRFVTLYRDNDCAYVDPAVQEIWKDAVYAAKGQPTREQIQAALESYLAVPQHVEECEKFRHQAAEVAALNP